MYVCLFVGGLINIVFERFALFESQESKPFDDVWHEYTLKIAVCVFKGKNYKVNHTKLMTYRTSETHEVNLLTNTQSLINCHGVAEEFCGHESQTVLQMRG